MDTDKRKYFDRLAPDWDDITYHDPEKLKYFAGLLRLKPGDAVLDVGCGTGITIPYIFHYVQKSGRITAVDFSRKMIDIARRKFDEKGIRNIDFFVEDVHNLPMNRQYNAILCYSCFPHFDDQQATLNHLTRGLTPGGRLSIAHSESRKAINRHHEGAAPAVRADYLPPLDEITAMLSNAGLQTVHSEDDDNLFTIIAEQV